MKINLNKNESIIGNWYFCDPDTVYNECYILDDSTIIFNNIINGAYITNYHLKSDSILFSNKNMKPYLIEDISTNQMLLLAEDNIKITFMKINKKLESTKDCSKGLIDLNELSNGLLKRSKEKCTICD